MNQPAERRSRAYWGAASIALLGVAAPAAWGQDSSVVIRGLVLDELSRLPLPGVEISVVDARRSRKTSDDGRFEFRDLGAGQFLVEARMIGYLPVRASFTLEAGEAADITFDLAAQATPMPEVVVAGTPPVHPSMEEFFRRRAQGHGHFITRQDIERDQPMLLSDMMDQIPGVRLECRRGRECWIDMGRAQPSLIGTPVCHVQYFIDGVRYGTAAEEVDINLFRPADIEGIEIYRGASGVPARYTGRDARCGVVLIWMRIGRR